MFHDKQEWWGEIKHSQYFSFPDTVPRHTVQLQPSIVALKLTSIHKDKGTREEVGVANFFLFPSLFFSTPVQYKMAKSTNTKQMRPSNSAVCGVLGHE